MRARLAGRASGAHLILAASLAGGLLAAQAPTAVSPGSRDHFTEAPSTCPTFSWGGDAHAEGYEIAVWQVASLEAPRARAELTLSAEIPAAALSWTPSAESCLAPGESFAWSVRAIREVDAGEWSEPSLFRTPKRLTRADLADLLRRLEHDEHHDSESGGDETVAPSVRQGPSNNDAALAAPPEPGAPAPPAAPGFPALTIDGEFGYETPQRRQLQLGAMEFEVEDTAEDEGFVRHRDGYISIFTGAGPLDLELVASADIPDVARMITLSIYIYDNNVNHHVDINCSLRSRAKNAPTGTEIAAVVASTNDPGASENVSIRANAPPPVTVDLKELIVYCVYEQSALGSSLRFYGATIEYEVDFVN